MKRVIHKLESSKDIKVKLITEVDNICIACPYNKDGSCLSGQKVLDYDQSVLRLCNLNDKDILTWEEFKKTVQHNILNKNKLKEVCTNCQWLSICSK